jgi:hypothetical protein
MKARKTVSIKALKDTVNSMLAQSTCEPLIREGMIAVLESALHDTGNYNGFHYLESGSVPYRQLPGINGLGSEMTYDELFANTDRTRACYN